MSQKRYKPEEIIHKLRVAEVESSKGLNTGQICRKLGITEQTYYRWRKQYGGMKVEQVFLFLDFNFLSIKRWLQLNLNSPYIDLNETRFCYSRIAIFGKKVHMFTSL